MLSHFATEIVEEIFLYLPYREFLRAIRLNLRLWSIAHNPKSPLRHRLRDRTSDIRLYLNSNRSIYLEVSIDETIPGSTNKRRIKRELEYDCSNLGITDEPYVESEEDRSVMRMEKSHMQSAYKSDDGLDGVKNSNKNYKYDNFSPDLSMRLGIYHLLYIEYFTINKKFRLYIYDGLLLNKFLLHFDAYDIRLAPTLITIDNGNIDLPRLYESKFFQQKIYALSFSLGCKAIENNLDIRHYEIHRNKLREIKRFIKYANIPIKHNDDDLLLLDNIEKLEIRYEDEITENGIARLIKKVYENKQGRKIDIEIYTRRKFTIEEVLKYVPKCKITRDIESRADFTNMFDEVFTIKLWKQSESYTYFMLESTN